MPQHDESPTKNVAAVVEEKSSQSQEASPSKGATLAGKKRTISTKQMYDILEQRARQLGFGYKRKRQRV